MKFTIIIFSRSTTLQVVRVSIYAFTFYSHIFYNLHGCYFFVFVPLENKYTPFLQCFAPIPKPIFKVSEHFLKWHGTLQMFETWYHQLLFVYLRFVSSGMVYFYGVSLDLSLWRMIIQAQWTQAQIHKALKAQCIALWSCIWEK